MHLNLAGSGLTRISWFGVFKLQL